MRRPPLPTHIQVRGASVHNLADIDVDVPLQRYVGITGVSGSGKSSLALGVLFAEGSRRFLDGLTTYQRRDMAQPPRPNVRSISNIPAALALRQRPATVGPRSSVATLSEVGAILRLVMSRLGRHMCPNGHGVQSTVRAWATAQLTCPEDGLVFPMPDAESFSSNSTGACPACGGLGETSQINQDALITDSALSIDQGAVGPWRFTGRHHMPTVARDLGVRTDVPFRDLSDEEREIVLRGPETKRHVVISTTTGRSFEMDAKYESAVQTVRTLGASERSSGNRASTERFLIWGPCAAGGALDYQGNRTTRPADLLAGEIVRAVEPLVGLGLGYLTPDRSGTLSTGERQRLELARTAMRRTTGMLYVLDEPTVGLHPAAVHGLVKIMQRIVNDGNTLVVVDHDMQVLRAADHLIEIGPAAGSGGGQVITTGTSGQLIDNVTSVTGPYLAGTANLIVRERRPPHPTGSWICLDVDQHHYISDARARFPVGHFIAVTGVSGAGKTSLVIDSLVPALQAHIALTPIPQHVAALDAAGIDRVVVSDSSPIGDNSRSTPATYCGVFDEVRRRFASESCAQGQQRNASWFSYNTKNGGRCPECEGIGTLSFDLQYLPDVDIVCPQCGGGRYSGAANTAHVDGISIAEFLGQSVDEARASWTGSSRGAKILQALSAVGLGYLVLGEPTPALSGGESQRLRLATELGTAHDGALFVFDEPSIGLHPRDVAVLIEVFQRLIDTGATVIVIEHDLDLVANADWVIDVGPGGGKHGGRIIAEGTVSDVLAGAPGTEESVIAPWLREHLASKDAKGNRSQ